MNSNKVQGFINEVVAQRLEKTLHQRHAEAVNARPTGHILRLPGEALLTEATLSERLDLARKSLRMYNGFHLRGSI